ncbi:hypothetical protein [Kineococcus sp. SYSU DK006]|uniref:hypothetical protein n=1 Tax=Kineococcus sp. SYSU DK006 TaxID=3383127 RepID=UPI003D7DEDD4
MDTSAAGASQGVPLVGVGADADAAHAPWTTTVPGHRLAVFDATQVLDPGLAAGAEAVVGSHAHRLPGGGGAPDARWEPARIVSGVPVPLTGQQAARAVADEEALRGCTDLHGR